MLKLIVRILVRTDDDADLKAIAEELRRRLETSPALRQEHIKAIAVTGVEVDT